MKKLFVLFIIAIFALSLAACGSAGGSADSSDSPADGDNTEAAISDDGSANEPVEVVEGETLSAEELNSIYEKAAAYIESVIDTSNTTKSIDDEQPGYLYGYWSYNESADKPELSNELDLDGNKIIIGTTTEKDLEALGMEMSAPVDEVEPDTQVGVTLIKDDKEFVINLESHDTDEVLPIGDVHVAGFGGTINEYTMPYNYQGFTNESTMEDAVKIFGNPNSSINLSIDDISTSISISYLSEGTEGDRSVSDSLELTFIYDAENNTATLPQIQRFHEMYANQ